MKNRPFVMPSTHNSKTTAKVATDIRRQLASQSNVRVLESMPVFRADGTLPKKLRKLLKKLEAAEQAQPLSKG
ncbi:hypothetical protein [Aminobacter sp. AP02]|uniref:hypothetical protein n=1 Tax=Aminobacter sp. AP02 TaxID=2135737 RepID=UPI000D6BFC5E|nr:hypothetical protein [Aminobacter sp. AP02]PWK70670.1 hypothetical protein C8K44_107149 [Aminobacter sp. AP02]